MASGMTWATIMFLTVACWDQVSGESVFLAKRSSNTVPSGTSAALSEEGYQQVASLKSDEEMNKFIMRVLHNDGLEGDASYLQGLVPWYSGTRAIQSLARLREELIEKPWVRRIAQASFISNNVAVDGANVSGGVSAHDSKRASAIANDAPASQSRSTNKAMDHRYPSVAVTAVANAKPSSAAPLALHVKKTGSTGPAVASNATLAAAAESNRDNVYDEAPLVGGSTLASIAAMAAVRPSVRVAGLAKAKPEGVGSIAPLTANATADVAVAKPQKIEASGVIPDKETMQKAASWLALPSVDSPRFKAAPDAVPSLAKTSGIASDINAVRRDAPLLAKVNESATLPAHMKLEHKEEAPFLRDSREKQIMPQKDVQESASSKKKETDSGKGSEDPESHVKAEGKEKSAPSAPVKLEDKEEATVPRGSMNKRVLPQNDVQENAISEKKETVSVKGSADEKPHVKAADRKHGIPPAAREALRRTGQLGYASGKEGRNHQHRHGRPERDAYLTGNSAVPSKARLAQSRSGDRINRPWKNEQHGKRAVSDDHPGHHQRQRTTSGLMKEHLASHTLAVDNVLKHAGAYATDNVQTTARGVASKVASSKEEASDVASSMFSGLFGGFRHRTTPSVDVESTKQSTTESSMSHGKLELDTKHVVSLADKHAEYEKPVEAAKNSKADISNAKIQTVSARMPRADKTNESGLLERKATMAPVTNLNASSQAIETVKAADASQAVEAVKAADAKEPKPVVEADMMEGEDKKEGTISGAPRKTQIMSQDDEKKNAMSQSCKPTCYGGRHTLMQWIDHRCNWKNCNGCPECGGEHHAKDAGMKTEDGADKTTSAEIAFGATLSQKLPATSQQMNGAIDQPSSDAKVVAAVVADNTITPRQPDETAQATAQRMDSRVLPEVPSLLGKSQHVLETLTNQVDILKNHLVEAQLENQNAVASKKNEYERVLEQQLENSTSMANANEQLSSELQSIREQNVELRNRARHLTAKGGQLRKHLLDLKANLTLAGEYLDELFESSSKDDVALLVLRQLDEQDAALAKSKEHDSALQQVGIAMLQTSSRSGSTDVLEVVRNLGERFDDLDREKIKSMAALKLHFEEEFSTELQHQNALKEDSKHLRKDRDTQLALRERLQGAVNHLEHAVSFLNQEIQGLQAYTERLASKH